VAPNEPPIPRADSIATYQAITGLLRAGLNVPEAAARVAPDFGITDRAASQRFYRVLKFEQATSPTPPTKPPMKHRRDIEHKRNGRAKLAPPSAADLLEQAAALVEQAIPLLRESQRDANLYRAVTGALDSVGFRPNAVAPDLGVEHIDGEAAADEA